MTGRSEMRGIPLDEDCKKAHTSRYEYGPNDTRVFCYGLIDLMNGETLPKCRECAAFVFNAEPPQKDENGTQNFSPDEKKR